MKVWCILVCTHRIIKVLWEYKTMVIMQMKKLGMDMCIEEKIINGDKYACV